MTERRKKEVEQKKKLLWGGKKKVEEPDATKWSVAAFEDPSRKAKFLSLIGAKKKAVYDPLAPTGDSEEEEESVDKVDKVDQALEQFYKSETNQEQQFADLEKQFEEAIDRKEKQSSFGRFGLGANNL